MHYKEHIVTNMAIVMQRFSKHRLRTGIVKPERMFIAEQRFSNYVPLQIITTNESIASQRFDKLVSVKKGKMATNYAVLPKL
jgi:hypothetical protein